MTSLAFVVASVAPARARRPVGPHCPVVDARALRLCVRSARRRRAAGAAAAAARARRASDALLDEARRAIHQSRRGAAEQLYWRAIAQAPFDPRPYFLFALCCQRRDCELARELFRAGVEASPQNARTLQAWGLFESKLGNMELAQRLLHRSVSLNPSFEPVLHWKPIFPTGPQTLARPGSPFKDSTEK
jgi:Tfp pilus assembly protein PilF